MPTLTAGRIAGIPIRISPSWFLALALSTVLVGDRLSEGLLPDAPPGVRWMLALATSFLFFASILLHELAHALVARRCGIPVASITLFLLGGVALITREARRPRHELLIAAAGPLTNLVLGGVFLLPLIATRNRFSPSVALAAWLGVLNLSLAIFNLAPGFPMDGGRILRAMIWGAGVSLRTSTQIACLTGRLVALLFIALGMAVLLRLAPGHLPNFGPLGALWLVVIGVYLERSARRAQFVQQVLEDLGRCSAVDLMLRDVPVVRTGARISDFLPDLLALRDCEAAFVTAEEDAEDTGDRMVGMVLRGRAVTLSQRDRDRLTAGDVMLRAEGMQPAAPGDDGAGLLQRLESEGLAAIPVVADGEVLGLVARAGLLRYALERRGRI
jgi:Zn-dependent protease